ncbi:MAG: cadherin repeat domain-containing protein [Rubripirellula sp.]
MNQRERLLSIVVGGLLIAVVFSWGFGKYRTALKKRNNQIASLLNEKQLLTEKQLQGEYANRQMGEYRVRSLPGNPELAQSKYQNWLLEMVQKNKVSEAVVDLNSSREISSLYQRLDFRVRGRSSQSDFLGLLHEFYATDYLHRIRDLTMRPHKEGGFVIELSVDAIALLSAPEELPERGNSWRVTADPADYRAPIMNRNLFQPPNGEPSYNGRPELEAIVGRDNPLPLTFRDPEGDKLEYEFAETPPDFVSLDPRSGTLRVKSDEKQEFEILVRVTDNGYPHRTTEQKLLVKVVDPPPPPPAPAPKLKFDDSKQTVLTALVQGREETVAWMHVRTRDQTLRLRVGDQFEIGSLSGKVVEVTPKHATLEIDGRRFSLKPAGNLNEAAKKSQED